jgi:hypothetical protein
MRAAFQEQIATVRCLIERGANVEAKNKECGQNERVSHRCNTGCDDIGISGWKHGAD